MSETNGTAMVQYDSMPTFVIAPAEAEKRIKLLQDFIQGQMVSGVDFGIIPGTDKPTLLKPGAEKLCAMYGFAIGVDITDRVLDIEGGFVHYEIKVSLRSKSTGAIIAEGVGSCNSREKRYKNREAADLANTVFKMAKKRALVDATLSATRSSGLFTQDVEDMDLDADERPAQRRQTTGNGQASAAPSCPKCHGQMWDNRQKKASGQMSANAPDFKCKDKQNCDGVVWPPRNGNSTPPRGTRIVEGDVVSSTESIPDEDDWASNERSIQEAFDMDARAAAGYSPN